MGVDKRRLSGRYLSLSGPLEYTMRIVSLIPRICRQQQSHTIWALQLLIMSIKHLLYCASMQKSQAQSTELLQENAHSQCSR